MDYQLFVRGTVPLVTNKYQSFDKYIAGTIETISVFKIGLLLFAEF
jgi:hypothetical protein